MNNEEDIIILNISTNEEEEDNVSKEEILNFFKGLKVMPIINREEVYDNILKNNIDLPVLKYESFYLDFCSYKGFNKDTVIINDHKTDNYYYIQDENVFIINKGDEQNIFYKDIAEKTNQDFDIVYDVLIDKLSTYEPVLLMPQSKYLGKLDEFIEDNIYMFNAALKEKEITSKKKPRLK